MKTAFDILTSSHVYKLFQLQKVSKYEWYGSGMGVVWEWYGSGMGGLRQFDTEED